MSAPMVRALLDGQKTQTRRIVKPTRNASLFAVQADGKPMWSDAYILDPGNSDWRLGECPYGATGDRLWVRETWAQNKGRNGGFVYRADHGDASDVSSWDLNVGGEPTVHVSRWRPSIHMPRAASRILLEITEVRVERLQQISEADALAEGISTLAAPDRDGGRHLGIPGLCDEKTAVRAFRALWSSLHGPESWDTNPWVWVVTFQKVAG